MHEFRDSYFVTHFFGKRERFKEPYHKRFNVPLFLVKYLTTEKIHPPLGFRPFVKKSMIQIPRQRGGVGGRTNLRDDNRLRGANSIDFEVPTQSTSRCQLFGIFCLLY